MAEQEKERPKVTSEAPNIEDPSFAERYKKAEMEYLFQKHLPTKLDLEIAEQCAIMAVKAGMFDKLIAEKGYSVDKVVNIAKLKVMKGVEVGLPPTESMSQITIINGTPTIQYRAALGLIRKHPETSVIRVLSNDKECHFKAKRNRNDPNEPYTDFHFTIEMAIKAGYYEKNPLYKTIPHIMLKSKCVGEMAGETFSDIMMGLQITEDMYDHIEDLPPLPPDSERIDISLGTFEEQKTTPVSTAYEMPDLEAVVYEKTLPPVPSEDPPKKPTPLKPEEKPKVQIPDLLDDSFYENIAVPATKPIAVVPKKTTDAGSILMAKAKTEIDTKKTVEAQAKVDSFKFADELLNDVVLEVSKTTLPKDAIIDIFEDTTLPPEIQQLKGKNWFGSSIDGLQADNEKAYGVWRAAFCKVYPKEWKLFAKEFRKAEKQADMTNMQHLVEHSLTFLENKLLKPNDLYLTFFHDLINGEAK